MDYKKYKQEGYNLHIIKIDKFKYNMIRINFKRKVVKEEITKRVFLLSLLINSCEKYKTERLMEIKTEDLYGLIFHNEQIISGNYNIAQFTFTYLNERYTEPTITSDVLDFIHEIFYKPNIEKGMFEEKSFELTKSLGIEAIKSADEDNNYYSLMRLFNAMDDTIPVSFRSEGYLEELKQLSREDLYQYYLSMIEEDILDIFVIGNVDDSIKSEINKRFKRKNNEISESHFITHTDFRNEIKEVKDKKDIQQSKLIMGIKLKNLSFYQREYVSVVYSYILGGGPESKLFKTVRTNNSLCYYIRSSILKVSNILTIQAGISAKDYQKTVDLIKNEIESIKQGDFAKEEIEKVKTIYKAGVAELLDSPRSILNNYNSIEYLKLDDLETRVKEIENVTYEDVIEYANTINIDTIYLLEGEE